MNKASPTPPPSRKVRYRADSTMAFVSVIVIVIFSWVGGSAVIDSRVTAYSSTVEEVAIERGIWSYRLESPKSSGSCIEIVKPESALNDLVATNKSFLVIRRFNFCDKELGAMNGD